MAAKLAFAYAVSPKTRKSNVLEVLAELQALPQHKWIPIEEMQASPQATATPRQADWMATQVAKRIEGVEISFEPVVQEEKAEA